MVDVGLRHHFDLNILVLTQLFDVERCCFCMDQAVVFIEQDLGRHGEAIFFERCNQLCGIGGSLAMQKGRKPCVVTFGLIQTDPTLECLCGLHIILN